MARAHPNWVMVSARRTRKNGGTEGRGLVGRPGSSPIRTNPSSRIAMRLALAPLRTVAALCIVLVAAVHQPAMAADAGSQLPAGTLTAAQHFALVRPAAPAPQPAAIARTAIAVDANAPTLRSLSAALF